MPTIQYTAQLDFTDNGTFETGWRIKQGDFGDCEIVFRVVNNGVNMYDASVTPEIVFRRADGASVISNMTPNDGTYKYTFVGNELAVPGLTLVDVKYTDSEGRISTASCRFTVVEDTIGYDPTGAHTYDNPVSELVETATVAAETAIDSSFKAEGFAVGEQGGVPVEEGSPYYHNNAKYYGQELAEDIEYNKQKGYLSRNLLKLNLNDIKTINTAGTWNGNNYTINNVTFELLQTDGVITAIKANGQATSNAVLTIRRESTSESDQILGKNLSYIGSGCPTGGDTTKYRMRFYINSEISANDDFGSGVSFTTNDSARLNYCQVWVSNGYNAQNLMFYPMIRFATTQGSNFTPYTLSNNELNAKKSDITAIGTNETGTTASKAYAIGEHFYKDGKFCTAKTAIASGATFTLNTNYVEGDVANSIDNGFFDLSQKRDVSSLIGTISTGQNSVTITPPISGLLSLGLRTTGSDSWVTAYDQTDSPSSNIIGGSASTKNATALVTTIPVNANRNVIIKYYGMSNLLCANIIPLKFK